MPRFKAPALLLSLATLSVPALAQGTNPAVRDSFSALNYVQGEATLNGQPVTSNPTSAPRRLQGGDVLSTTTGTADIMLAPGTLLRLGNDTSVQLVATTGNRAEARIENGRANIAVNTVRPHDLLLVDLPNGQTQVLKRGLYTFDAPNETVRVYNGEADAFSGADTQSNVKPVKVKEEHEVTFGDGRPHPTSFDRTEAEQDLLPWTGPQEAHADGEYGLTSDGQGAVSANYVPAGFASGPYGFDYGYPFYAGGWGYPYGFYGYPFGFYGYPFGVGFGFGGYRGFQGGYGYSGLRGGVGLRGPYHGGEVGGFRGGFAGHEGGFSGGGFHGGGFGGGGRR